MARKAFCTCGSGRRSSGDRRHQRTRRQFRRLPGSRITQDFLQRCRRSRKLPFLLRFCRPTRRSANRHFYQWKEPRAGPAPPQQLEVQFGPEYESWLELLGAARETLRAAENSGDPESTKRLLHQLASENKFEQFRQQAKTSVIREGNRLMGRVYLIGAGPGDPELLTVKAARLLASADIVLYDSLVSQEILNLISASAQKIDVGKRAGPKLLTQGEINSLLISYAANQETVVRLKGGDPGIFGRAGEEIAALREASVPFEIVPGITAALGAAAAAGISLTDRRVASQVLFTTFSRGSDASQMIGAALPPPLLSCFTCPARITPK